MKRLREAHLPLSFCLEFIIIAFWKRLVEGVKVSLFKNILKLYAFGGGGEGRWQKATERPCKLCSLSQYPRPASLYLQEKRGSDVL